MLRYFFGREETSPVDSLIDSVLSEMHTHDTDSEEYARRMTYLERLCELKENHRREPLSRDTLVAVGGNLLGILVIVAYEQKHVMTSKALALVRSR